MKLYIILTADIHPIGGMQIYVANKVEYLKKQGWSIEVFFAGSNRGVCKYTNLNPYVENGMMELQRQPYEWPSLIRKNVINKIISKILKSGIRYEKIVIESQSDVTALWGEVLAEKLRAKHFCFICNERFRGRDKHYEENLDFFDFKHRRRELACIHKDSFNKLFDGYKYVPEEECYKFNASSGEPVQDVENQKITEMERKDWNICYVGRAEKAYVPIIIEEVSKFVEAHQEKSIQMVFVGDQTTRVKMIEEKLGGLQNLTITYLGDLVPIPRNLYKKLDVVIAGAGCATASAREGIPTIVADAGDYLANGVYGYTTHNSLFRERGISAMHYDEVLEQVLVQKITEKCEFVPIIKAKSDVSYSEHIDFIKHSVQLKEYFCLNENIRKIGGLDLFKFLLAKRLPNIVDKYIKIRKK